MATLPVHAAHTALTLAALSGLSIERSRELVNAVYKCKPALKLLRPIVAPCAFVAWLWVFVRGTDALRGTALDLMAFLVHLDLIGAVVIFLLSLGAALALAMAAGYFIPRAALRRAVRHCLHAPACFWCGYSLTGLQADGAVVTCPECGKPSPVAAKARTLNEDG